MKKISILVPTYNEEENVEPLSSAIIAELEKLPQYDYEILFIDNASRDRTREILRKLCQDNSRIKAIFNVKNFGQFNSPFYGMLQTSGDCVIGICADFQDPVGMIPQLIAAWESGYRIVLCQKTASQENSLIYFLRSCYYKLIKKFSDVEQIEHITGFGLYDKSFIEVMRKLHEPIPFLRCLVAELGYKIKIIPYEQQKRRAGKTHNNFFTLYDAAMLSMTSYTKVGLRVATFIGAAVAMTSFFIGIFYLILKLIYWDRFVAGNAPILIGLFFLSAILLGYMGIMGEYILTINRRLMDRPLVVEEERINFNS